MSKKTTTIVLRGCLFTVTREQAAALRDLERQAVRLDWSLNRLD